MDTQTMNIIAVIVGPIIAIIITLVYQSQKEKREAKTRLFLTLMAHRKSNPPTIERVNSLNLIDVVFADHPKILQLWHEYYDLLNTHPPNHVLWEHKHIDMLSEISQELGYKKIKQTEIEKFYTPQAHTSQSEMVAKIQAELLRVLENTASLGVTKKEGDKK
jgi:predicted membrane protein